MTSLSVNKTDLVKENTSDEGTAVDIHLWVIVVSSSIAVL